MCCICWHTHCLIECNVHHASLIYRSYIEWSGWQIRICCWLIGTAKINTILCIIFRHWLITTDLFLLYFSYRQKHLISVRFWLSSWIGSVIRDSYRERVRAKGSLSRNNNLICALVIGYRAIGCTARELYTYQISFEIWNWAQINYLYALRRRRRRWWTSITAVASPLTLAFVSINCVSRLWWTIKLGCCIVDIIGGIWRTHDHLKFISFTYCDQIWQLSCNFECQIKLCWSVLFSMKGQNFGVWVKLNKIDRLGARGRRLQACLDQSIISPSIWTGCTGLVNGNELCNRD